MKTTFGDDIPRVALRSRPKMKVTVLVLLQVLLVVQGSQATSLIDWLFGDNDAIKDPTGWLPELYDYDVKKSTTTPEPQTTTEPTTTTAVPKPTTTTRSWAQVVAG